MAGEHARNSSARSMSDVEVRVRVVNPPSCQPPASSGAWKSLDVFARVGRKENGEPVLVVGCVRNGQWVPLTFFDRSLRNWWDRLSYVPSRWLPSVDEKPAPLKSKEKAASMAYYDSRLSEVPKRRKVPVDCPGVPSMDKRLSLKSCTASGDRLSRLPQRRKLLKKQVYQYYHDLYKHLTGSEEDNKRLRLMDKSIQKLDAEAERLKRELAATADEEQQKILSLLNYLLDMDADEFVSHLFAGREEAFLTSRGHDLFDQGYPQSVSTPIGTIQFGENETEADFTAVQNRRESQQSPQEVETQEETTPEVLIEPNSADVTPDEMTPAAISTPEQSIQKNELDSEPELEYFTEQEMQEADLQNLETSSATSEENEINSTSGESYWSAQDQNQAAITEVPQYKDYEEEQSSMSTVEENLSDATERTLHEYTTGELDSSQQLPSESTDFEETSKEEKPEVISPESSTDQISELHLSLDYLEDFEEDEIDFHSTPVKKTKSIISHPVRKNWLVEDERNLPWWERLSRPRIYKPTPFYIPPFKATPYTVDPNTPRRTKKTDLEQEEEKFVLQMSARSRKIMRKKIVQRPWWFRLSRPKISATTVRTK